MAQAAGSFSSVPSPAISGSLLNSERTRSATSFFFMVLALLLATILETNFETACAQSPQRVGGPCQYIDIPGTARIISVQPLPPSAAVPPGSAYQPYAVLFTFTPAPSATSTVSSPEAQALAGRSHSLTLSGGAPPGPQFLRKYAIRPGAAFACEAHIIRKGTCTPILFTLQGVNMFDRSERAGGGHPRGAK